MTVAIDDVVALASGARTSTQTGPDILNAERWDGVEVALDLTAFSTAASLALSLQRWDPAKGAYLTVLTAANLTAVGQAYLRWGPLIPDATNVSRAGWLPTKWRWVVTHNNGNSHTYSLSYHLFRLTGRGA